MMKRRRKRSDFFRVNPLRRLVHQLAPNSWQKSQMKSQMRGWRVLVSTYFNHVIVLIDLNYRVWARGGLRNRYEKDKHAMADAYNGLLFHSRVYLLLWQPRTFRDPIGKGLPHGLIPLLTAIHSVFNSKYGIARVRRNLPGQDWNQNRPHHLHNHSHCRLIGFHDGRIPKKLWCDACW